MERSKFFTKIVFPFLAVSKKTFTFAFVLLKMETTTKPNIKALPMALPIIYFNSRDKLIRLVIQKIVYFESDGNYTYIVTANKQRICITMNLAHTEQALASQLGGHAKRFMRIGKRLIVNMNYIYQIDIQKQTLMLSDCEHFLFQIPVSKEALKTVKELVIQTKI